jgi:hypothetical protein
MLLAVHRGAHQPKPQQSHQIITNDAAKYSTTTKVEDNPKKAINFFKPSQSPDILLLPSSSEITIKISELTCFLLPPPSRCCVGVFCTCVVLLIAAAPSRRSIVGHLRWGVGRLE